MILYKRCFLGKKIQQEVDTDSSYALEYEEQTDLKMIQSIVPHLPELIMYGFQVFLKRNYVTAEKTCIELKHLIRRTDFQLTEEVKSSAMTN